MDKVKKYEAIILKILEARAAIRYANLANLEAVNELVVDKENNRYQVVTMGWERNKRVHAVTMHFDIIDGKIWIQQDQTEYGVADELLEMGVPKSDIVLAYFPFGKGRSWILRWRDGLLAYKVAGQSPASQRAALGGAGNGNLLWNGGIMVKVRCVVVTGF